MAEPVCIGSFIKTAGLVTQAVPVRDRTGHAFFPRWWYFICVGYIGSGGFLNGDAVQSNGFDDGTNRRATGARARDNASGVTGGGQFRVAQTCYSKLGSVVVPSLDSLAAVDEVRGYVSSATLGSYDFTWTASSSAFTSMLIVFVAGGGASSGIVGSEVGSGSTGHQTFTSGLSGGAPSAALMMIGIRPNDTSGGGGLAFSSNLGFMNSDGCQGTYALLQDDDSIYPPTSKRYQRTSKCLSAQISSAGGIVAQASAVSLAPAAITVDWDISTALPVAYLAIYGMAVSIFSFDQPPAGTLTLSGLGQTPEAVLMMSIGAVSGSSIRSECQFGMSATNGSAVVSQWLGILSGAGPTVTATYFSDTSGIIAATPTATSATIAMRVSTVTLQVDGFRIALGLADATARQILCLVFGTSTYVPGSPCTPSTVVVPVYPPPVIGYEDPCLIVDPRIHLKIETASHRYRYGVHPLRDPTAMGGFKEPRVIEMGPITKAASDILSGAWPAQTASARLADTDRVLREISRARGGLRNCDAEFYLTGNARRLAAGAPRTLFAGKIYHDTADENLVLSLTLNDLIGVDYSLLSEEKQIPQRVVSTNDFPAAPEASLGLGIPILGGRVNAFIATLAGQTGVGVVDGIYVGPVNMGGAVGIPGPTDLATVVAALQASVTAGTVYQDYGSRIGYADALVLQAMGTVPSTYAALAAVIGFQDLDALLNETAVVGGAVFEAVVIAGHAISEILATNASTPPGGPSIWIDDVVIDPAELGVSVWAPQIVGDGTWLATFGAPLFTDIVGADTTVRRYTLILFDPSSTYGLAVAAGSKVHVEVVGMETAGDGTGTPITDYWALYLQTLVNFLLQNYQTGAWLTIPEFLFSDGVTLIPRVDAQSFVDAATIMAMLIPGGALGSFAIGAGGQRASIRDVIANFNRSGAGLLVDSDYGQLRVGVLDRRRLAFLNGHRTLRDTVDILPGFTVVPKPEWQVNQLAYQYAPNYHTGKNDRGFGGGGSASPLNDVASQTKYGVIKKPIDFPYVRDDVTALGIAECYLALLANMPNVAQYRRRGLCGLEDDLLQGVPITHYNGYGANGWQDHAVWVIAKTFDPKTMHCSFVALDVEAQLT